jgi:hypothetical protein
MAKLVSTLDDVKASRNGLGQNIHSVDLLEAIASRLVDDLPKKFLKTVLSLEKDLDRDNEFHRIWFMEKVDRLYGLLEVQKLSSEFGIRDEESVDLAYFQISEIEKAAIYQLASDMRRIVSTSAQFDGPHKVRLLKRISAIEQEIQKEKGLLDVILGGVSDVGETAGKFGKDVKPLVERMQEIEQITRGGSPDYAQLAKPEELKKLPAPKPEPDDP